MSKVKAPTVKEDKKHRTFGTCSLASALSKEERDKMVSAVKK